MFLLRPNDLLVVVLQRLLVIIDLVLDFPMVVLDLPDFDFFLQFRQFAANFLVVLDLPGLVAQDVVDRHASACVRFLVVLELPSWFLVYMGV